MTDPLNKQGAEAGRPYIRPVFIVILVGVSIFLSAFFLISPKASSEKYSGPEGPRSADQIAQGGAPLIDSGVRRFDFLLKEADTFFSVMSVFNLKGAEINEIVKATAPVYDLRGLRQDTVLRVFAQGDDWQRIEYSLSPFETLVVKKTPDGVMAGKEALPHETRLKRVSGVIESSLYEAGLKAGAAPELIMSLSDIFAWEIDFTSDVRKGDTFNVLYEATFVEGREVATGDIIGAEMMNEGKTYSAVYFEEEGKKGGYYDLEGRSLKRALLKSPLRFRRVTSYFTRRRFHPILKRYRPHHGIDYAAPVGTPVESAGSGRVAFAGWRSGYGNTIEIRHSNSYATVYAHLSRIARGVTKGASIEQGEVIGYVGSTGISTGPHLHYEVRVAGRLVNPLSIRSMPTKAIAKAEKGRFEAKKKEMLARLNDSALLFASNPSPPITITANAN